MMSFVLRLPFIPLVFALAMTACGRSYETEKIKDYRIALVEGSPELKEEFRRLVREFNSMAGIQVLSFVDEPSQANSAIIVTEGLRQRDGKVGWGQWMSESKADTALIAPPGSSAKRTVSYSMRLEFDADYFRSRLDETDPKARYEKQKLFFHEAGHGLEMNHVSHNKLDLMYPDISGDKDFTRFFENVRAYMSE